jgi:hypothetical protein
MANLSSGAVFDLQPFVQTAPFPLLFVLLTPHRRPRYDEIARFQQTDRL